jgi:hypothetical protein
MTWSPRYLRRLKKGAQKSHERQYPGDYVFDYVAGDGATFDQIDARAEIRDRRQWVGWMWALRGFGRRFRLYLTNPAATQFIREMFGAPSLETMQQIGYGLFAGKKQERA